MADEVVGGAAEEHGPEAAGAAPADDHEGRVTQMSWRSTVLRTRDSTLVSLPNSSIVDGAVINYSEPAPPTRIWVEVSASFLTPPNRVKAVIADALTRVPLAMSEPPPDVLVAEFGDSAIRYRARCYVQDMERSSLAQDQMRTAIWYAFQRHRIDLPYQIQIEYQRTDLPVAVYPEQDALPELIPSPRSGRIELVRRRRSRKRRRGFRPITFLPPVFNVFSLKLFLVSLAVVAGSLSG